MKFKSLRFKINVAILTTCAIIAVFFSAILYPFELKRRQVRLEEVGILLSAVYHQRREEIANQIFAGQKAALADALAQIQNVDGICLLTVYQLDGGVLISTDPFENIPLPDMIRDALGNAASFSREVWDSRPCAVYATDIRVIGERIGYLKIYFDMTAVQRESDMTFFFFIALFLSTLLLMSLVLNLLLARSVIRPVSMLRKAILRVQAGELGEQVPVSARDEIGEMGAAFNEMSALLNRKHCELTRSIEERDAYFIRLEETNQALAELNSGLETMVAERTRALLESNEKLQQEINERKRADEEKRELEERLARSQKMEALGLLAGGVAHDLNNVLSGIVTYPEILLADLSADNPVREPLQVIHDSGRKAAAIVQDLLTLARRGVTTPKIVNLNPIIQDYLGSPELKKLRFYHPDVEIEARHAPDLLNIRGSSVHLRKAVMNLVSNAAEAQPDGGRIVITTENRYIDQPLQGYEEVQEGDYVVLTVEDYGVGITSDEMDRIFEPFYTKKVMGRSGTGLGMTVVWGTVQDHQGYINVRSTEGEGTVFDLYFPATREVLTQDLPPLSMSEYTGNGETVLVVDDVREQRKISAYLLTRLNYRVETVSGGEEAVSYLKTRSADVLVLDMIMDPGMDGLDTYRKILEIRPGQKAVIASGFAESERVRQAQKLGAGQYIRKPYTLEKIGMALKNALRKL